MVNHVSSSPEGCLTALFPFPFDKVKTDFLTAKLILLIYIFNKGL